MRKSRRTIGILILVILGCTLSLGLVAWQTRAAVPYGMADDSFGALWSRTDALVTAGRALRGYMWGPGPLSIGLQESYAEAPNGKRLVQYFDKGRMELPNPSGDKTNPFYVTSGLLTREMMFGQIQTGDNRFENRLPAEIGIAGDADDLSGPTYRTMASYTAPFDQNLAGYIVASVDRDGNSLGQEADFSRYKVGNGSYVYATGHNIAKPFWEFLNQTGVVIDPQTGQETGTRVFDPVFYSTGLPITEAFWTRAKIAGAKRDVLVQVFERRVLTYNPQTYLVEMGNVGQHYFQWRYNNNPDFIAPPTPTLPPEPTPTPTFIPTIALTPAPTSTPAPVPTAVNVIPAVGCLPSFTGNGDTVQACVNNATASVGSDEIVYSRLIVSGQVINGFGMETVWHFPNSQATCSGSAGSDGVASCSRKVAPANSGYKVLIDITYKIGTKTYNGTATFTTN